MDASDRPITPQHHHQPPMQGGEHAMTSMDGGPSTMSPQKASSSSPGHRMSPTDPDNPMNWPLSRKIHVSAAAFGFVYTVIFGITSYTAGISALPERFPIVGEKPLYGPLSFSLPFLGIALAPIYTPHLSERVGRAPVYWASLPLFSLCILGVGLQTSFSGVLALRFLAGFFGGPCVVLIEGTFADVWTATRTVGYYSILTLASFLGAASGPIIGGFVFAAMDWQWLQWVTLMIALAACLLAIGTPETYGREILRTRARRNGTNLKLARAESGETLGEMFKITVIDPLVMLVSEPIVIFTSLYLGLNFAVVFQWFLTVPAVLQMVYGFNVQRVGLAFIAAFGGAILAAFTSILLERLAEPKASTDDTMVMPSIEKRLYPAMVGSLGIFASLFWIGFTADPMVSFYSPIFGTALYVWGNASVLISAISYLFDAYPPAGTLSALTAAATFRLICAGTIPVGILPMFMNLTGAWALGTFGFISLVMIPLPFLLYKFGPSLRAKSRYSQGGMSVMETELMGNREKAASMHETV